MSEDTITVSELQRIKPEEGEVLALLVPRKLTDDERTRTWDALDNLFKGSGARCLILEEGIRFQAVKA